MVSNINNINPTPPGKSQNNGAGNAVPATNTTANVDTNASSASQDSVELSPAAQELSNLQQQLQNLPEVDEARVEAIRQQIAEGSYSVDANEIAARLLNDDQNYLV